MLSVARSHFASIQPQIKSLNSYATFDEAYFDLIIQRMNFMRESISIYRQNVDTQISKQWISQVHTNLSNLYKETGRILESLDELEPVKLEIGMALGNYASKLYTLAFCTLDKSERKEMLIDALSHYKLVVEKADEGFNEESLYERALDHFRESTISIERLLEGEYAEIKMHQDFSDSEFADEYNKLIGKNEYRAWCKNNRLALSFRNLVNEQSDTDDIHLPNLGMGYYTDENLLTYYSWFNTVKQEFNIARYMLYQVENSRDFRNEPHVSQQDILLINTLDYPAVGYNTELLKMAFKTAYSVLDKIGLICRSFMGLPCNEPHKIQFTKWFYGEHAKKSSPIQQICFSALACTRYEFRRWALQNAS